MARQKRKLTPAEKRERKRAHVTISISGTQKRVPRAPLAEGLPVDEFIRRNADLTWLHQNGLWELMPLEEARDRARVAPVAQGFRATDGA